MLFFTFLKKQFTNLDPIFNAATIASTSQVCTAAILEMLITESRLLPKLGVIQ